MQNNRQISMVSARMGWKKSALLGLTATMAVMAARCATGAPGAAGAAVTEITPPAVTASSDQGNGVGHLVDGAGLSETAPGSGILVHTSSKYVNNQSTMWNGDYPAGVADYNPWVMLDLGKAYTATGLHVWNYNENGAAGDYTFRGFKEVEVSSSMDGKTFAPVGTFTFQKATGKDDYAGERIDFKAPVKAQFLELKAKSNWGGKDVSGLSGIRVIVTGAPMPSVVPPVRPWVATYPRPHHPTLALGAILPGEDNIVFPADSGIVDVTKAPYNAKGDGVTDDTAAIQAALADHPNAGAIIYLPNGSYLLSNTLKWPHGNQGGAEEKNTTLQGQSRDGAVLKLKDHCPGFDNPHHPKSPIWTGNAPAQRFGNEIRNLTVDTGVGNPGAAGIQFMANNEGCVRDVTIVSGDGQGVAGLDLAYTDENGPLFIKNVRVTGFDIGIHTATSVDSETMEHITLEDQNTAGLQNDGQPVSVRDLKSTNAVPAVINNGGLLTLIDSSLTGKGAASGQFAVLNGDSLLARNLKSSGYKGAIESRTGAKQNVAGPDVIEFHSKDTVSLFPSPATTLGLPIRETPDVPWGNVATWTNVRKFKTAGDRDDTASIQAAIDSGATTIYLPRSGYKISDTILVRGSVRRIIGCKADIDVPAMDKPVFKVVDGDAPVVVIERISSGYTHTPTVDNASSRTLVFRDGINVCGTFTGTGDVFLEDVCSNPFSGWNFGKQHIWARQFNVENEGTHVVNNGATLWILGFKTERGGTLINTSNGGSTELLGGFCYTTTAGKLAPMFIIDNSRISISFAENCFNGDPYTTIVQETHEGVTKTMKNTDPAYGSKLVLFTGAGTKGR